MMNFEASMNADDSDYRSEQLGGSNGNSGGGRRLLIAAMVILALAAAIGLAYFLVSGGDAAVDDGKDKQAASISVIAPGKSTIEGQIVTNGTVAARREMPVGVAGEGGRVVSVPVEVGQWVQAGQVLAYVDRSVQNQQVSSASAQIDVANADARLAKANLDRALQLVDRGFISKADVDRLTATHDAAVARVNVARAQVGELRARNARLSIVAPAAGLVLERNVEPGQIVSGGSGVLFLIAKGGEMELMAQLSEIDLARIAVGVTAKVVPVGTEKGFSGQVWQISPTINAQNRQGIARIALPYAPELRPGGFAKAIIQSGTVVAPMLPESAVLSDNKGNFVYIVGKDNKAVRRDVKTGMITNDGIAIIEGLNGTELVVLRAGGFLTPGETISPKRADKVKG